MVTVFAEDVISSLFRGMPYGEFAGMEVGDEPVYAASPRLALTGTGRIALTPQSDAEITVRFHDSSLDPYVRLYVPKLSPFTTAVATGSIRIVGEQLLMSGKGHEGIADFVGHAIGHRLDEAQVGGLDFETLQSFAVGMIFHD